MARIKTKKKEATEPVRETVFHFYIIILILLVQTGFLFYKNYGFIIEHFEQDPNFGFVPDVSVTEANSASTAGSEIIDPSKIRVSILNGCGEPGLAALWKDKLRNFKYDIRETGNASNRYNNTVILSRIEDMRYARHLSRTLGIKEENVLMQINKDLVDIDVTLIVGSDHKNFGN